MRQRYVLPIFACCCSALLMTTVAYGQATPKQNPPTTPPFNPSAKTESTTPSSFLSQAIEINEAEVEVGRLASSRAMDKRVKDFANMMIKTGVLRASRLRTRRLHRLARLESI
jgi:predicted outer membrane protein